MSAQNGSDSPKRRAVEATVHGRVQGVGFRYYTQRTARKHRITGYVQNLADGSVRVVCEGRVASVDEMIKWLHHGPPSARVRSVELRELQYHGQYASFTVET